MDSTRLLGGDRAERFSLVGYSSHAYKRAGQIIYRYSRVPAFFDDGNLYFRLKLEYAKECLDNSLLQDVLLIYEETKILTSMIYLISLKDINSNKHESSNA